ncbi:outer membrane protein assembly factor BamD [Bdellovibrio svalbardensis]|uniref:Lipoprotein n=1 Tax=Bdellovibrio svalbardensis TaxID=2972972 RepID=A0ABT6DFG7_9BACT|nr:hypothetical protein [Bdellovibrio svalbardensis]MDG0815587.1 hypothetical protein [Bdellovibrio svalbardensis]
MSKFKNILILIACLGLTMSCAKPNVFEDYASKDSDEALYADAQKKIDALQWDNAIDILENQLSAGFKTRRDVLNTRAGAYAGKCGIKFSTLVNGLKNASGGSANIFPYMMNLFSGVTVTPSACESAITIMQQIGAVGVRTADENLFISILGLARISTTLAAKLDAVDHDGIVDAGSNVCDDWVAGVAQHPWTNAEDPLDDYLPPLAAPAHYLTTADIQKVAAGVGLITENLTALGDVLGAGNSVVGAISNITTACTSVGITCTITDPALVVDPKVIYGFRLILDTTAQGFGSCTLGTTFSAPMHAPPAVPADYAGVCCPFHKIVP